MPITTTPSGGPQGEFSTYTPIYAQTLSSNASSITFSNIPTTFTDLVLVCSARSAWTTDEYEAVGFRFNSDSSNNYSTTFVAGNGGAAASFRESSQPQITARMNPSTSSNTAFSSIIVQIQNYSNNTTNKTVLIRSNSSVEFYEVAANVGTWRSTSPITSLFVGNARANLVAGSTFTLYGIKAAAAQFTPVNAAGGDYAVSDETYAYHVFRSSGVFAPAKSLSCDVLVVAGGGGGSGWDFAGGGGGAGGLQVFASQSISTPQVVTVGSGGAGNTANSIPGGDGGNSVFGSLTASVGGGGGGSSNNGNSTGRTGGSGGGGGAGGTALGGTASPAGQGNAGGNGFSAGQKYPGGGGGGAGAAGANTPNSATGGAGGIGLNTKTGWGTFAAMVSATGLGASGYFAGGGGGGVYSQYGGGAAGGAGGLGGGGNGAVGVGAVAGTTGTAGEANTGGGGGGQGAGTNGYSGGSGVVVVRYALNA